MKNVLFVTSHNRDIRVKKFVNTIASSEEINIDIISIGNTNQYYNKICRIFSNSINSRKLAIIFNYFILLKLIFKNNYNNIIVVNDSLFLAYISVLIFKIKILTIDNHDSMVLKTNNKYVKKLFVKINKIVPQNIVTDINRFEYFSKLGINNSVIIPNVPDIDEYEINSKNIDLFNKFSIQQEKVNVLLAGTIAVSRGIDEALALSEVGNINVYAAGVILNDNDRKRVKNSKIIMLGRLEVNDYYFLLENFIDYLICIYYPLNDNQIYASPNKIYDAISFNSKIIINDDVLISDFVKKNNLGLVFSKSENIKELKFFKQNFKYCKNFRRKYIWSNYNDLIIKTINLNK